MTCNHCVAHGIIIFVQAILSSSTTRKNKKKKKVCVTVLVYIGVGVDRGLYCGVCVRGGCVMLSAPSSTIVCVCVCVHARACVRVYSCYMACQNGKHRLGSVFSVAGCKMQARQCYIKSLPSVPIDKKKLASLKVTQGERSTSCTAASSPTHLPSRSRILI